MFLLIPLFLSFGMSKFRPTDSSFCNKNHRAVCSGDGAACIELV